MIFTKGYISQEARYSSFNWLTQIQPYNVRHILFILDEKEESGADQEADERIHGLVANWTA